MQKNYPWRIWQTTPSTTGPMFQLYLKQMVGINFHEYLTRVRFQHALNDLTYTRDNLTDIALKNGFPDLKTLTARFRSTSSALPPSTGRR